MKLAIMQPYFFPYIGYWQLINAVDMFILFDNVQFIRHGWIERNRILKPQQDWQYISAPLIKHNRDTKIKDIKIKNENEWKEIIIRQLAHYKKYAPYYLQTIQILNDIFSVECDSISQFNYISISKISSHLNIKTKVVMIDDLDLKIEKANAPDEWALNICKSIKNVKEYWNPEGGLSFFDKEKYFNNNINIKFLKTKKIEYNQKRKLFEPFLSIIDVMMFNSLEDISNMLTEYDLV